MVVSSLSGGWGRGSDSSTAPLLRDGEVLGGESRDPEGGEGAGEDIGTQLAVGGVLGEGGGGRRDPLDGKRADEDR